MGGGGNGTGSVMCAAVAHRETANDVISGNEAWFLCTDKQLVSCLVVLQGRPCGHRLCAFNHL